MKQIPLMLLALMCVVPSLRAVEAKPAVNVVYFVPSDLQPSTNYHARLNGVLKAMSRFYNEEMRRHEAKAELRFQRDPARPEQIRIFTVQGKEPHTGYPRNGGGAKAHKEVEAFFAANPGLKASQNVLVLMPCEGPEYGPFHGWGKYCFAIDFAALDMRHHAAGGSAGKKFAKYYGGMAHELGHALGLPHNHATRTDGRTRGTALMASGNYTLSDAPTFITPASAKILEVSESCRLDAPPERPSRHVMRNAKPTVEQGEGTARLYGKLPVPNDVHALIAVWDKDTWLGVNNNYDAETFVVPVAADGSYDFTFPKTELTPGKTPYVQVQLRYIYEDGTQELYRHTLDPKPEKEQ